MHRVAPVNSMCALMWRTKEFLSKNLTSYVLGWCEIEEKRHPKMLVFECEQVQGSHMTGLTQLCQTQVALRRSSIYRGASTSHITLLLK